MTKIKFRRMIAAARPFEKKAFESISWAILPYYPPHVIANGLVYATPLRKGAGTDEGQMDVLFNFDGNVEIALQVLPDIFAYGGYLPSADITILDDFVNEYRVLEVDFDGEPYRFIYVPEYGGYYPEDEEVAGILGIRTKRRAA